MDNSSKIAISFIIVIFLLVVVGMIIKKNNKSDEKKTSEEKTSSSNYSQRDIFSTTGLQPLADYNNMLISDPQGNVASIGFPLGTIVMWSPPGDSDSKPPSGWAICDGSTIEIKDNQNNVKSFVLPDLRGRFPVGVNNSAIWNNTNSGYALSKNNALLESNPKDSESRDLTSHAVSSKGGSEKHTLDITEMPKHKHSVYGMQWGSGPGYSGGGNEIGGSAYMDDAGGDASTPYGKGVPHNNMPPFCAVLFIIKIGV